MSIKELASALQISTATVSYILNGKAKEKRISEELEKKVKAFALENNYKPNQLAKSLRSGKSKIICLMVEDIADIFFAGVAGYIEEIAYNKGYKIIYCSTKNETEKTQELISTFRNRNVDGYIITPPNGIEKDIESLLSEGIPVVLFDRYLPNLAVSYVGMDNRNRSYEATKHLIGNGFKHIAFITLVSEQSQMNDRLLGYQQAMEENELTTIVNRIAYSNKNQQVVVEQIVDLVKNNPQIDSLYFATNYLAVSGLVAINQLGLKLSADIGMIVFDDSDLFRVHQPTISAIAQPVAEMSVQIINTLLGHLQPEQIYTPDTNILPGTIFIRESSVKKEYID